MQLLLLRLMVIRVLEMNKREIKLQQRRKAKFSAVSFGVHQRFPTSLLYHPHVHVGYEGGSTSHFMFNCT
jgi:hypothetical protein